jgi:hypothetical protein
MDFTRKARFVAGGHTTTAPATMTYSSVVSRDSICFEGGIECGEDHGKDLGYESTKADPDVWICKAVKDDGHQYYEILCVYVDDILALSHRATDCIKEITTYVKAKEGSIKPPDIYLGANISTIQLPDGREVWSTSPKTYVKNSLLVVDKLLEEDGAGYSLKNNARNPFPTGYKPEIDITDELNSMLTSRYLQLIGILRWAVEIGCIDIFLEVSLLSHYQANPRLGHLEAAYHIFAYLQKHPARDRLAYDSKQPDVDASIFHHNADWKDFYGDVEEELPPNMPKPRGHSVIISAFV